MSQGLHLCVRAVDDPRARVFVYEFDADRAQLLLGRRGGVDVLLPSPRVSLVHARIERRAGRFLLIDAESTNGTEHNTRLLAPGEAIQLGDADVVRIANFEIRVSLVEEPQTGAALSEKSEDVARRMVRDVFDRLGDERGQPTFHVEAGGAKRGLVTLRERGRTYLIGFVGDELHLDDLDPWRPHLAIERDDSGVTLRDIGAVEKAEVGGVRFSGARRLVDGDRVTFDGATLLFSDPAESYLARMATPAVSDVSSPGAPRTVTGRRAPAALAMWVLGIGSLIVALAGLAWIFLS